jgi:hypothetical protein
MPSGNATYTYTGKLAEIEVSGQAFVKDEPALVTDNGVIAQVCDRADFVEGAPEPAAEPKPKKVAK